MQKITIESTDKEFLCKLINFLNESGDDRTLVTIGPDREKAVFRSVEDGKGRYISLCESCGCEYHMCECDDEQYIKRTYMDMG